MISNTICLVFPSVICHGPACDSIHWSNLSQFEMVGMRVSTSKSEVMILCWKVVGYFLDSCG